MYNYNFTFSDILRMSLRLTQRVWSNFQSCASLLFGFRGDLSKNSFLASKRSFYALQQSLENIPVSLLSQFCYIGEIAISKKGLIHLLRLLKPKFVKVAIENINELDCLEILRECNG